MALSKVYTVLYRAPASAMQLSMCQFHKSDFQPQFFFPCPINDIFHIRRRILQTHHHTCASYNGGKVINAALKVATVQGTVYIGKLITLSLLIMYRINNAPLKHSYFITI